MRNEKGVDHIVLGCTDLSNVAPPVNIGLNDFIIIDSLEVLADAIISDINEKN